MAPRWCREESVESGREDGPCLLDIALIAHADVTSQWPEGRDLVRKVGGWAGGFPAPGSGGRGVRGVQAAVRSDGRAS